MDLLIGLAILVGLGLTVYAAGHALLYKRRPRAAMAWIVVCLALPFLGPGLYFLFGINRIRTRAQALRSAPEPPEPEAADEGLEPVAPGLVPDELRELTRISAALTGDPLVGGNRVDMLHDGEGAYPSMLAAIDAARHTLYLATYIFESNSTGRRFVDALARAQERGVVVRVLVDGVGELYSRPRIGELLEERGVPCARFLPPRFLPPSLHLNLRNHRKILIADGRVAFAGGMNLGDRHLAAELDNPDRVVDLHFRLEGPIAPRVEEVFLADWAFATGERLPPTEAVPEPAGSALCRVVVDGPDDDLDRLYVILVGAVSAARRRVAIMTPYFLPPRELLGALVGAAVRGVRVDVVLPEKNNLPFVHWATRNMLWELLKYGVRVYYQPPPFAHSKLFLVDETYVQLGSANLDPRSLRLNFEIAVEVFDPAFAATVCKHFDEVRSRSRSVTLVEVDSRPLPARLRDAASWLFTPYL